MTSSTTTTATTAAAPAGVIEHLDPAVLVIEANVRSSAPLTKEFLNSIRVNGILTPVLARRDEQGNVIVRAGQRRTLASRELGLPSIPVYVVVGEDKTAERIVQQIIENDQRAELSTTDRTAAWAQLAFEGVSAATIARRTGEKVAAVKKGLAVEQSATIRAELQEHELTLDQAAILLEFEDDDAARAELIRTATTQPGQFAHAVQRHRDARTRATALATAQAEQADAGYTILTREDVTADGSPWVRLEPLRTPDGSPVTVEHIQQIEPRGAYVTNNHYDGGLRVLHLIQDPKAHGFTYAYNAPAEPETDEEKAQRSAERKVLLANNRAWSAAETVRREWLTVFLARKALPKDADAVIAAGLTVHRFPVAGAMTRGNSLAHTLLGIEQPYGFHADALATLAAQPGKARLVTLAVVLAGMEAATSKESWRRGDATADALFRQLALWGYDLSPVERVVTGDLTAAEAAAAG